MGFRIPLRMNTARSKNWFPHLDQGSTCYSVIWVDFILILVFGLTPLLWFKPGYINNGLDVHFPLEPISHFLDRLTMWSPRTNTGQDSSIATGAAFIHGLEAFGSWLGFSLFTTQKLTYLFWFILPGFSIYFLMWVLQDDRSYRVARLIAVSLYMHNHFVMQAWSSAERTKLSVYAVLPFCLAILILVFEAKLRARIGGALIVLTSVLASAVGLAPPSLAGPAIVLVVFILGYLLCNLLAKDIREMRRKCVFLLATTTGVFFINAYWLVPEMTWITGILKGGTNPHSAIGTIDWLPGISSHTSLLNVSRMQGDWGWYDAWGGEPTIPFSTVFRNEPFFIILSFSLPLFCYSALFFSKSRYTMPLVLVALLGTLFSTGAHPPFGTFYVWMAKHVPFLFLIRSPWYKFTIATALAYACLAGLAVEGLCRRVQDFDFGREKLKIYLPLLVGGIAIAANLIYNYPMLSDRIFFTDRKVLKPTLIKIPNHVFTASEWLSSQGDQFRVLLLPQDQADNYTWGFGAPEPLLNLSVRTPILFDPFQLVTASPTDTLRGLIYKSLYSPLNMQSNVASKVAGMLSAKYLLQRNDADYAFYGHTDSPAFIKSQIALQKGIFFDRSFGPWDFYRVDDRYVLPRIYATANASLMVGSLETTPALLESFPLAAKPLLISASQEVTRDQDSQNIERFTDGHLFSDQNIADLVLALLDSKHRYRPSYNQGEISVRAKEGDVYSVFVKTRKKEGDLQTGRLFPTVAPLVRGGELIRLHLPDPDPFFLSSKGWHHLGTVAYGRKSFSLALKKEVGLPFTQWRPFDRSSGYYDLFMTTLPDDIPAGYTTRQPGNLLTVYRNGVPLEPTWGRWKVAPSSERFPELVEVGRVQPRRVVINIPKGQMPVGYTVAYVVPKLSDEVEELIIVPQRVLRETIDRVLTLLGDPNKRIAYLFTGSGAANGQPLGGSTPSSESFYTPKAEGYLLLGRITPNVQMRNVHLSQTQTDWEQELAKSKWQISEIKDFNAAKADNGTASIRAGTQATAELKKMVDGRLVIPVRFEGDGGANKSVLLKRLFSEEVNLEEYPHFRLSFTVENPDVQTLEAGFGVDYTGDGKVDGYVIASPKFIGSKGEVNLNLFEAAKEHFADAYFKEQHKLKLVELYLVLYTRLGIDISGKRKGVFKFILGDLQLFNNHSITIPGSQVNLSRAVVLQRGVADVQSRLDSRQLLVTIRPGAVRWNDPVMKKLVVVLKDRKQLTGIVEKKDQQSIRLNRVNELAGRDAEVNMSAVAYSFDVWEKESVGGTALSTQNVELLSIPVEGKRWGKYPFLTFEYGTEGLDMTDFEVWLKVRDSKGQTRKVFAGKPLIIDRQRLESAKVTLDLDRGVRFFEFSLDQAFPEAYTTQGATKSRFVVLKDGQPIGTTWQSWQWGKELVEVGAHGPRSIALSVPLDDYPLQHTYVVSYLPPEWTGENSSDKGAVRMDIDLNVVMDNARAELVSLDFLLRKTPGTDLTSTEQKVSSKLWLGNVMFIKRVPYPAKDARSLEAALRELLNQPLAEIDGTPIALSVPADQTNLLDRNGYWLKPLRVDLAPGVHTLKILSHPTFKVDLVEVANKPLERSGVSGQQPPTIEFRKINPTRYVVDVEADRPFWLVFNESFHEGWKAYARNSSGVREHKEPWSSLISMWKDRARRTELKDHFIANGYANGWYVDTNTVPGARSQARKFQIVLEYQQQRLFEIGLLISGLTFLGCLSYLGYTLSKHPRSERRSAINRQVDEDQ